MRTSLGKFVTLLIAANTFLLGYFTNTVLLPLLAPALVGTPAGWLWTGIVTFGWLLLMIVGLHFWAVDKEK